MTRPLNIGGSQAVTTEDFNARVKRLLAGKSGGSEVTRPPPPKRPFGGRSGPRP